MLNQPTIGQQLGEVLADGPSLRALNPGCVVSGRVEQTLFNQLGQGAWTAPQHGQQLALALGQFGSINSQIVQELFAVGVDAAMVRGDPDLGGNARNGVQAATKIRKVGAGVTVVGTESGQVDITDKQHLFGLDQQGAMACGVAGQVEGGDTVAAQIPERAVLIANGVGAWGVMELALKVGAVVVTSNLKLVLAGCGTAAENKTLLSDRLHQLWRRR